MEDQKLKTAFEHLEVAKRHIERAEQECDEIGEKGYRPKLWIYNVKASVEQAALILKSELSEVDLGANRGKILRQSIKETA